MATVSNIEWTDVTWNPVTGCTKVSQGCKHCYLNGMAKRLKYRHGFRVTLHEDLIELPLSWRKPRTVLVNSMSDLFHERVPLEFIRRGFDTMQACGQHTFQILTKRSERLVQVSRKLPWPPNVWMGVSVEDAKVLHRARNLAPGACRRPVPANR